MGVKKRKPNGKLDTGRPSKYQKKFCKMLEDHMGKGYSIESFGAIADCSKETIYEWTRQHPDFSDAKKRGEAKSRLFWEKLGVDNIINKSDSITYPDKSGKSSSRALNSAVWCFNMKNRFGWRDKPEGDQDINLNFNLGYNLDDDENE